METSRGPAPVKWGSGLETLGRQGDHALLARGLSVAQARSKRSLSMTFTQAFTKFWMKRASASSSAQTSA